MRAELEKRPGRRLQLQPADQGSRRGVDLRHPRPGRREDLRRGSGPHAREARGGRSASSTRDARLARRRDLPRRAARSTSSPTSIARRPRATACPVRDVEDTLESAYGGKLATSMWEGERKVGVRVKLPIADRGRPGVGRPAGDPGRATRACRCRRWPSVHVDSGRTQINREQGGRFLALKCNIEGRDMGTLRRRGAGARAARGEAARGLLPDLGRRVREPAARDEAAAWSSCRSRCW